MNVQERFYKEGKLIVYTTEYKDAIVLRTHNRKTVFRKIKGSSDFMIRTIKIIKDNIDGYTNTKFTMLFTKCGITTYSTSVRFPIEMLEILMIGCKQYRNKIINKE